MGSATAARVLVLATLTLLVAAPAAANHILNQCLRLRCMPLDPAAMPLDPAAVGEEHGDGDVCRVDEDCDTGFSCGEPPPPGRLIYVVNLVDIDVDTDPDTVCDPDPDEGDPPCCPLIDVGVSADACGESDCSLRQAVIAANLKDNDPDGVVEGELLPDVIAICPGTVVLDPDDDPGDVAESDAGSGDLDILQSLLISSFAGEDVPTVIQGGSDRIFQVHPSEDESLIELFLTRVTLQGGGGEGFNGDGGAILNDGFLQATEVIFKENGVGEGNGGALHTGSGGDALLIAVSVIGNRSESGDGGGVSSEGVTAALNSTFGENFAGGNGGAIYSNSASSIESGLRLSTVAGNDASGSGDGIYNAGTVFVLKGSIIDGDGCAGPTAIRSEDGNVEFPGVPGPAGQESTCGLDLTEDVPGVSADRVSPASVLRDLDESGMPIFPLALSPLPLDRATANPALDFVVASLCSASDGRGVGRPYDAFGDLGNDCDSGAFEARRPRAEKSWEVVTEPDVRGTDDGDGKPEPGEVIRYTVTITNEGELIGADDLQIGFIDAGDDAGSTFLKNGSVTTTIGKLETGFPPTCQSGLDAGQMCSADTECDLETLGDAAGRCDPLPRCLGGLDNDKPCEVDANCELDVQDDGPGVCLAVDPVGIVPDPDDPGGLNRDVAETITYEVLVDPTPEETISFVENQGFLTFPGVCIGGDDDGDICEENFDCDDEPGDMSGECGMQDYPSLIPSDDPVTLAVEDKTLIFLAQAPRIIACKAAVVLGDEEANPGDTIRYTVVLTNEGGQPARGAVFEDVPHRDSTLIPDSVVLQIDGALFPEAIVPSAESVRIEFNKIEDPFEIEEGGRLTAVVTFDVRINDPIPLGCSDFFNVGHVTGDNFEGVDTDDPSVDGLEDETSTEIVFSLIADERTRFKVKLDFRDSGQDKTRLRIKNFEIPGGAGPGTEVRVELGDVRIEGQLDARGRFRSETGERIDTIRLRERTAKVKDEEGNKSEVVLYKLLVKAKNADLADGFAPSGLIDADIDDELLAVNAQIRIGESCTEPDSECLDFRANIPVFYNAKAGRKGKAKTAEQTLPNLDCPLLRDPPPF